MAKTKQQKGFGKLLTTGKQKKSSNLSLLEELRASQREIEQEVIKERKEQIKGISSEELEQSEDWLYVMADDRCVKGTLDELLDLLSQRTELSLDRDSLREEALKKGGIDVDITGEEEIYETIEFDPAGE